jgi:hypothetical protein
MSGQIVRTRRRANLAQHRQAVATRPRGGLPMLRTSERSTFKRCRWKWWHEFEETLHPKTDAPPLRFGSLVHKALADYYKKGVRRGPHPAERFLIHYDAEAKLQGEFGFRVDDLEADEVWAEARELGVAMLEHYVEHYGKDDEWEVLVTEQPFQQIVNLPGTERPWFWYVGTLDLIIRNRRTKKIHIVDHKTAKTINVMYLSLDSQATGYWTFGLDWIYANRMLQPLEKPAGMIYNHLRKAFPDERPKDEGGFALNKDGTVSKKQPAPYFTRTEIFRDVNERAMARAQVLAEFLDMQNIRAEGRFEGGPPLSAYKNQGQMTCPGCWLFDFCELHEIGADWEQMREHISNKWDPYDAHEIYTGETR